MLLLASFIHQPFPLFMDILVVHQPDHLLLVYFLLFGGGGGRYESSVIIPDSSILILAYQQCHSPCDMLVVIIEHYYCEHGLLISYLPKLSYWYSEGEAWLVSKGSELHTEMGGGALVSTCSLNLLT